MEFGKLAVIGGCFFSALTAILYLASIRGNSRLITAARVALLATGLCVISAFGRLMFLVANHHFEIFYVFEYSSPDLVAPWKYAATWAGQEGSFLLWSLWTAIIGGLVAWKAGKWENRVMPLYISVITFLMAILIWLSPFKLTSDMLHRGMGPNDYPMDLPWPPNFGKGLHPSLQNYWMAIHPPTIFFGFASLAVPFCFAVASLIRREYNEWIHKVMPWVLLSTATLGVGLFMGGYWAYETQGWHGFWAWDPVENASLFPWLACLGLLHGLVVQKSRGGMGRTNVLLATVAWVMFLYGTYLTRSGVLSNFSVHSFVSLASKPLILLIAMIGIYSLIGGGLLLWRWKSIPAKPMSEKFLSRDTAMVMAVSLMVITSVIIAIGTSWPLISQWSILKSIPLLSQGYSAKGMAAQPIFYNKLGIALLIPTLLALGSVPFLAWRKTALDKFQSKVFLPWITAAAVGFGIAWFVRGEVSSGVAFKETKTDILTVAGFQPDTPSVVVVGLCALGLFVLFSNFLLAAKILKSKAVSAGGWLAHVGIATFLVGAILTNVFEKTFVNAVIEGSGPMRTPFGYQIEYAGWTHDELEKQLETVSDESSRLRVQSQMHDAWKQFSHAVKFTVSDIPKGVGVMSAESVNPGKSFTAESRVFLNNKNVNGDPNEAIYMRWPYIHKELFRDFYISISNDPARSRPSAVLRPGQERPIAYLYQNSLVAPTQYTVQYEKFFREGATGTSGTLMGAVLVVTAPDGRTARVKPALRIGGPEGVEKVVVQIPEMNGAVVLRNGPDPATKSVTAEFEFGDSPAKWIIPVAITNKPMINLVWLGIIVMGIGTLIAMVRRSREARKGEVIALETSPDDKPDVVEASPYTAPGAEPKPKRGKAGAKEAYSSRTKSPEPGPL